MSLTARPSAPTRRVGRGVPGGPTREAATPLPLVVSGAVAGGAAALLSYLALAVIALGAWMLDPSGAQEWSQMLEAASGAWLAGLGVAPTVGGITVTLLPIGFALVPIIGLAGAARWATEASAVARRGEAFAVAVSGAIAFAGVAALIASLSRSLAVSAASAALVCGVLAFVVILTVVMSRARLVSWGSIPPLLRDGLASSAVALATLVALSAILLAVSVVAHASEMNALLVELDPGLSGAVLLAVLSLGYLPTAVVWSMAYVVGPGVTVAVGTSVSAFAEPATATLPGFPLLAALPGSAPAGAAALPGLVLAVGVLAGLFLRARGHTGVQGALAAAITAAFTCAALAIVAWLTSGSIGTTSLQGLGPSPLWLGAIGGALVGAGALGAAAWPARRVDV